MRRSVGFANKGSPPQAAGYSRSEPVGGSGLASGTHGLPLGVVSDHGRDLRRKRRGMHPEGFNGRRSENFV
jgi:hypothetical protein